MRLLVTSLGRVGDQRTIRNLPPSLREQTSLVVQAHEADLYAESLHRGVIDPVSCLVALPPHIRTLGATRQWAADAYRGERVCLLDDDLDFYWRPDPEDWHLRTPGPSVVEQMFQEISNALEWYDHVGVSGREGQNRMEGYGAECTRYMRLLAYALDRIPERVRWDRVDGMSDFDANLQLLELGRRSYVFYRWAQGQPGTQTAGGMSSQRSHEIHEDEVARMCMMWPEFIDPTLKQNKSGGEFGTRTEVRISWRAAIEYG